MAADKSLRPTPRKKSKPAVPAAKSRATAKVKAAKPAKAKAPKAAKPKAPAPKVAKPKVSLPKPTSRPAAAPKGATEAGGGRVPGFLGKGSRRERPDAPRERRQRYQRAQVAKMALGVLGGIVALAFVGLVAFLVLRSSSVFEITSVEAEPTEHLTVEDIGSLTQVPVGSTLLDVDTASIEESLKKNPWVASVEFERVFPHTLKINVVEQTVDMLVVMGTRGVGWYLSDSGTWIQPTKIEAEKDQSTDAAALEIARSMGCLLVTDVPATVNPTAGSQATDEALAAVSAFQGTFSEDFASKVVCYFAPSVDDISCMLESGVQVSLGSPEEIETKERIVSGLLEEYEPGQITAINVRIVSEPSVKTVDSDNVQAGEGALGESDASDEG